MWYAQRHSPLPFHLRKRRQGPLQHTHVKLYQTSGSRCTGTGTAQQEAFPRSKKLFWCRHCLRHENARFCNVDTSSLISRSALYASSDLTVKQAGLDCRSSSVAKQVPDSATMHRSGVAQPHLIPRKHERDVSMASNILQLHGECAHCRYIHTPRPNLLRKIFPLFCKVSFSPTHARFCVLQKMHPKGSVSISLHFLILQQ